MRALLINGGGERTRNFRSHLLHVQELVRLLVSNGVAERDIAVFASDGENPTPDLAVRDMEPEPDFWLIEDVWPGTLLGNRVRYENTTLDGVLHRPAKKKALRQWIESHRSGFRAGDILLVYVTDHGSKNKADLANNGIVLWGEELSVNELRELLEARGIEVADLDDGHGFRVAADGGETAVVFVPRLDSADGLPGGETVALTLAYGGGEPPAGTAVLDLLARRVHGGGGVVLESVREFCRKRGIRLEPGPWRYSGGLI